jgi:TolB-like protein/DNA-binding winged helix-turn-helix (wHTH) protein
MPPPPPRIRFGDFTFDTSTGELWRGDRRVPLQRQPSRLLELLIAKRGELVSRDEIRAALWGGDTHVDFERSLNFCVAKLRAALRDDAANPAYVETLPTRGYRFIAELESAAAERESGIGDRTPAPLTSGGVLETPGRRSGRRESRLGITVALTLVAVALVIALRIAGDAGAFLPKVVVVPFKNETGSADLDRIAKGVSDATVARLAGYDRLRVIGNASGLTLSFRPPDMKAMGESLGAEYLVLGQMKRDDRQMRIVAHLIRVSDQTHVWARTYDSITLDLPQQSRIAAEIAAAVAVHLGKG